MSPVHGCCCFRTPPCRSSSTGWKRKTTPGRKHVLSHVLASRDGGAPTLHAVTDCSVGAAYGNAQLERLQLRRGTFIDER